MAKKITKRAVSKSPVQIKRDLEIFTKGVERLKELERELNLLDTRGFYREEQTIRAMLKNVSDIPYIEKAIKTLRLKINKKYKPKRRKSREDSDIKKIKEQVPEIKSGLRRLDRKIEELSKKPKGSVSSDVGSLVDEDFNRLLKEIKIRLSQKFREDKKKANKALKLKLREKEKLFKRKYSELASEFREKRKSLNENIKQRYKSKVRGDLKEEISRDFSDKLKSAKMKIRANSKKSLEINVKERLESEKNKIKRKLEKRFIRKLKSMERRLKGEKIKKRKEKIHLIQKEKKLKDSEDNFIIKEKEKKKEIKQGLEKELKNKKRIVELEKNLGIS